MMLYPVLSLLFLCNYGYAGMIQYSRSDQVASIQPVTKTDFGEWGKAEYCYDGSYAAGFRLNVDLANDDKTGVDAVVLFCKKRSDFSGNRVNMAASKYKNWGIWGNTFQCPAVHFLKGVAMKSVESKGLFGDDIGANNLRFLCEDGSTLTGDGGSEGEWSSMVTCPANSAICGIKTKVEDFRKYSDNTALNQAIFYCCSSN